MTPEEIYKLYRKTEYDSPKLLKVLADVCSITVENLKQIIKDGDEKSMPKGTRWTDEQHAIYDRMTAENAKAADIAEAMGVPVKAVHSRRSNDKAKLNSIHEPQGKPATINKEFDDLFDSNTTYTDCAPDIDTGEDVSEINAKIADPCELPDPMHERTDETPNLPSYCEKCLYKDETAYSDPCYRCSAASEFVPKPLKHDYTESLLETLREAIEFRDVFYFNCDEPDPPKPSQIPVLKQRTVFDEAHATLWSLESMAKRNGIPTEILVIRINERIIAEASDESGYDAVSINKKNPLAGTAIPTSGEA